VGDVEALAAAVKLALSEPRAVFPDNAVDVFRFEHATDEYLKILLGGVYE
jgi:hypothetical protein